MDAAGRVPARQTAVLDQAIALLRRVRDRPGGAGGRPGLVERLGLGLAGLINVVNPDRVLLGGLHKDLLRPTRSGCGRRSPARSPWGRGAACRSSAARWTTAA